MPCTARRSWLASVRAVAFGSCMFIATSAVAQDSSSGSDNDLLRQMQEQMQRLMDENQQMRSEIDELRAATHEDWLTEQRAAEIRQIVFRTQFQLLF